jgi:adenine-specific DNA-methyltransferase
MNRLDLQTPDFVAANAARLAEIFPNCVSETRNPQTGEIKRAIDFDLLRQELAYDLVEGPQERYRLDWPGKREALALANEPIRKTLRPCKDESVDFENTRNLYIEGDNLDALKLLQETYLGKVKMIYIDPPYNTGNDFIYDDNFSISGEEHDLLSGARDEEGNAMFQEEKWKQNSSASGRFHSEWLSMIYPRLKLARNLLAPDGLIAVTISDSELYQLGRVMDEIFGAASLLGCAPWLSEPSGGKEKTGLRRGHEYVLIYFKSDISGLSSDTRSLGDLTLSDDRGPYSKGRELMKWGGTSLREDRPKQFYPLPTPKGTEALPYRNDGKEGHWRWGKDNPNIQLAFVDPTFFHWEERPFDSGVSVNGLHSRLVPYEKVRTEEKSVGWGTWLGNHGRNADATRELKDLFGFKVFDTPKPLSLLSWIVNLQKDASAIVLDFFAGCGSTAHAVMQLNAEDGGKRRHIMVQIPEPCGEKSEAFKAGYKTIAEIGKERIRRAGKKILEEWQAKQASSTELLKLETENPGATAPDVGFRVLKVDSSNMADVYYQPDELTQDGLMLQVDNLRPGRKPEDLLFQVLLDWGVDLALPITEETILKRRVFFVAENALAACFDTGLDEDFVKELAKRQPLRAVFRDSSYASDAVKINFEQIFKALSPHTELKTL